MGNLSGAFAALCALVQPGLVVPHIIVEGMYARCVRQLCLLYSDLSQIDWEKLREAGITHVVIDKDNCITLPQEDSIIPEISPSWDLLNSAGFKSVMVVSNSAGSSDDPLAIEAEQLSKRLDVSVLAHPSKKPAMACARKVLDIVDTSLSSGHIAVVGDRVTTDIILASRMNKTLKRRRQLSQWFWHTDSQLMQDKQVVGILTTKVWQQERFGTHMLRSLEMWFLHRLVRIGVAPSGWWIVRKGQSGNAINWQNIGEKRADTNFNTMEVIESDDQARFEAREYVPLTVRLRLLPSQAMQRIGTAFVNAGVWLGQGWCLINDGIRLGTMGRIGAPQVLPRSRPLLHQTTSKQPTNLQHLFSTPRANLREKEFSRRLSNPRYIRVNEFTTRSFSTKNTVPKASARSKGRYGAALAALLIMPTGYYAGTLLHDYFHKSVESSQLSIEEAAQKNRFETNSSTNAVSTSPSLADYFGMGDVQEQSLMTRRIHLQRDLDRTNEKLHDIRRRMEEKHTEGIEQEIRKKVV